jgi:hypothetical protein
VSVVNKRAVGRADQRGPVRWHEGMFLRPHHFQAAQRHAAHELNRATHLNLHHDWGLRALANSAPRRVKRPTTPFGDGGAEDDPCHTTTLDCTRYDVTSEATMKAGTVSRSCGGRLHRLVTARRRSAAFGAADDTVW